MCNFKKIFPKKAVIGMVHLKALPGSPDYQGNFHQVVDLALQDLKSLEKGGVTGVMIENFFDSPFFTDQVPSETISAMTKVITHLREATDLPLGVNVLRNDAISAVSIATVCQCQFIRVNILTGAMITDQGLIQGQAARLARHKKMLDSNVLIFSDILVKHATPLGNPEIGDVAHDTWERGGTDALIVSGAATGKATKLDDVKQTRQSVKSAKILIGSGVNPDTVSDFLQYADGVIVGTYFKKDGKVEKAIDEKRVKKLMKQVN